MRGTPLKRSILKRSGHINKTGSRTVAWRQFRNLKAERDRDEDGLLKCEDWKLRLPQCHLEAESLDLHHLEGRDGSLLLDESKLIWLSRPCHQLAHQINKEKQNETRDTRERTFTEER